MENKTNENIKVALQKCDSVAYSIADQDWNIIEMNETFKTLMQIFN